MTNTEKRRTSILTALRRHWGDFKTSVWNWIWL